MQSFPWSDSDGVQVASTVVHEARAASSPSRRGSFRAPELPFVSKERQQRSLADSDPRYWIQQALRIDVQPLSDELLELLMHRLVNIQILTHHRERQSLLFYGPSGKETNTLESSHIPSA